VISAQINWFEKTALAAANRGVEFRISPD